jgi:hypothetical protein
MKPQLSFLHAKSRVNPGPAPAAAPKVDFSVPPPKKKCDRITKIARIHKIILLILSIIVILSNGGQPQ